MTITAVSAVAAGRPRAAAGRRQLWPWVADATTAAALLWWAFALTHGSGGRDRWTQTIGMLLALVALSVVRPWRVLVSGRWAWPAPWHWLRSWSA